MLIEAMACGVPVLASRSGEIPHVIADAGILLPEDDVEAWAAALGRVLADPDERRDLADRGLRRARTEFAWPVVARRHLEFFDELVAGVMTPLKVAIIADLLEEKWPSMDLVADMLVEHLRREHASRIEPVLIRPPLRGRLVRVPAVADCERCVHRRSLRQPSLGLPGRDPRHCRQLRRVPYRRSQLRAPGSHAAAGRTLVTCHDLDTFRSILEPGHDVRSLHVPGDDAADPGRPAQRRSRRVRYRGDARCARRPRRRRRRPDQRGAERAAPELHAGGRTGGRRRSGAAARPGGADDGAAARRQHDCPQAHRRAASRARRRATCSGRTCGSSGSADRSPPSSGRSSASSASTTSSSCCRSSIARRLPPSTAAARWSCCRPSARDSACRCSRRWRAERRSSPATSMRCVRSAVTPSGIARPRTSAAWTATITAALTERRRTPGLNGPHGASAGSRARGIVQLVALHQ